MKPIIKLTSIILCFINYASAQSWNLIGNTPGSADFLGATNAQDLKLKTEQSQNINFYTNAGTGTFNNQRVIITGGGNVGIGTTSPNFLLHQNINSAAATWHQFTNSVTGTTATDGFRLGIDENGFGIIENQEALPVQIWTNKTVKMEISSAGRVGIGTTSQQNLLHQHVATAISNYHQFTNSRTGDASGNSGFRIGITDNGTTVEAELRQNSNAPMRFWTNALERMAIAGNGHVGIGISTPQNLLHLNNPNTTTAGNFYQQFTNGNTGPTSADGFRIGLTYAAGQTNAELNLQENIGTMNFLTNATQRMIILNGGAVGIGTTPTGLSGGWLEIMNSGSFVPYALRAVNRNTTTTAGSLGGAKIECTTARTGAGDVNTGVEIISGGTTHYNIGVNTTVDQPGAAINSGGSFYANRGTENRGVTAVAANDIGGGTSAKNMGVLSVARGASTFNKAFSGEAHGASDNNFGIDLTVGGGTSNYGVKTLVTGNVNTDPNFGANLTVQGVGSDNYGAYVSTSGATGINYGVSAVVNGLNGGAIENYALKGYALGNGTNNFGVKGVAQDGTNNYGIYGSASISPSTCSATTCTQVAGYFAGDVVCTGSPYQASDEFLKQNINPLQNSLSLIAQLQPKTFVFKDQSYPQMHLSTGLQYGVIAEDIEQVFPGMVKNFVQPARFDNLGNQTHAEVLYKAISYNSLIAVLIAGMQEQQVRIDSLVGVIGNAARPAGPAPGENEGNLYRVNLSNNSQEAILYQNEPNPFSDQTKIRYFIPENTGKAIITFYDNMGKPMKETVITEKGQGTLEVEASNLNSAIYTYSLVIDGKVIDTKHMVKMK